MKRIVFCGVLFAVGIVGVSSTSFGGVITDPSQLSPNPTIIDFEEIDTGGNLLTPIPTSTFGNATFESLTASLSIFDISLSGAWANTPSVVSGNTLFPGGEPDSAISIIFTVPVAEVLIGWGDPDFAGNVLRAFDASGNLLEEGFPQLDPPSVVSASWIGFRRRVADIAKVVIQPDQSLSSGDDYVIDNIHYNISTIPEPTSLTLLGIGTASLFGYGWRKRTLAA